MTDDVFSNPAFTQEGVEPVSTIGTISMICEHWRSGAQYEGKRSQSFIQSVVSQTLSPNSSTIGGD